MDGVVGVAGCAPKAGALPHVKTTLTEMDDTQPALFRLLALAATGTPDLGYTSRGLPKHALMRLSRKSLAISRKLGLVVDRSRHSS
jgi:hypothetical protein